MLSSTIVLAGGGASGVNAHSLVALESRCFVAVGDHLLCLNIPALDLVWKVTADDATVFGIHFGHGHEYLIVHGEMAISRVSLAGVVEWSRSGADVFSGDLRLEDSVVAVRDFAERLYRFRLSDGGECG